MDLSILIHPSRWCAPVVIYALLSLASLILLFTVAGIMEPILPNISKWAAVAIWAILVVIMMYIMLYLCAKNLEWVAWVILLLPVIAAVYQQLKK